MKNLFLLGCFAFGLVDAYAQFSYKDILVNQNQNITAEQAICITQRGEIVRVFQDYSTNSLTFRTHSAPDYSKYIWKSYNATGEPHEIITLKNGGYAVVARNHFGVLDKDFVVTKSIGSKMTDWRAPQLSPSGIAMARWKQGEVGVSVTSVDFLEVAESPNGNYVCGLFIWHAWQGDVAEIRLGLAVADMTQGGKMTLHDLKLTMGGSSPDSPIEAAMKMEMVCLDDSRVLIGFVNGSNSERMGQELVVIDYTKIIAGMPLDAEVWYGHPSGDLTHFDGMFADKDGTVYYAAGDAQQVTIAKAKWDGSKMVVLKSKQSSNIQAPHIVANLNDEYFILSGQSYSSVITMSMVPYFIKMKKSDLTVVSEDILKAKDENDARFGCAILDVYPLDPANLTLAVLMRGGYDNTNNPGPFYLTTVQLSK